MKQQKWHAWEYRVLAEGHSIEKTAQLLNRTEAEVEKKLSAYHDTSLERWYQRHRVPGSPDSLKRLRALARKINRERFESLIEDGEMDCVVFRTLRSALRTFKPIRVPDGMGVEKGFIRHFSFWVRRRLLKLKTRRDDKLLHKNRHKHVGLDVAPLICPPDPDDSKKREMAIWSRHLLRLSLPSLDPRMGRVIELHYFQGADFKQISKELDISPKTITNLYSFGKIVPAVKKATQAMMLKLPATNLDRIIYYLHYEADFSEKDLAELLCIPRSRVDASLDRMCEMVIKGFDREKVMSLLG